MAMATEAAVALSSRRGVPVLVGRVGAILALSAILAWPSVWNGYPIVFADTGTYLSQAIHRYLGWDRPAFYSLFMLPLHMTLTTWPVVAVQALLTAWVLGLLWQALAPARPAHWLVALGLGASVLTWLPWLASELMPDIFTPLLVITFGLLAFAPDRLTWWTRLPLIGLCGFMISAQLSSLPLWFAMAGVVLALFGVGVMERRAKAGWLASLLLPPAFALLALCTVNLLGHGRFSPSPFGNVFFLARLIADGPAADVLRDRCPEAGWRLCAELDRLPSDSDRFLWDADSPILDAGRHKAVSTEAGAIILATVKAHPWAVVSGGAVNTLTQFTMIRSGDGLEPWPVQVSSWIARDFPPAEAAAYHAARQQRGILAIPAWLNVIHMVVAVTGMVVALPLAIALRRRAPVHAAFLALSVLVLPVSAAITGALSTPHDRYQARLAFLPAMMCAMSAIGLCRSRA